MYLFKDLFLDDLLKLDFEAWKEEKEQNVVNLDFMIDEPPLTEEGKKYEYDEPTHVRGYTRHDKSGKKTYVAPHGSEAEVIARDYETEEELGLDEKKYETSPGAAAVLKKHGGSCKTAVDAGGFDWAKDPYAVCNATKIVTQGHPTVPRGSKFTKGKGPHGKGRKLIEK